MKRLFFLSALMFLTQTGFCQSNSLSDPEPYFSAIIVKDLSTSLDWYSEVLGYETLNNKNFPEMSFKQANLKRGDSAIELIELGSAISPAEAISDFNSKSKLIGLFKIGFRVEDFDKWMSHLEQSKVNFHGRVVSDELSGKRMVIFKDPDDNRIQLFEK